MIRTARLEALYVSDLNSALKFSKQAADWTHCALLSDGFDARKIKQKDGTYKISVTHLGGKKVYISRFHSR